MKWTSSLVDTLSGSMGDRTASTSRGGVGYFRKKVVPNNPRTLLQTALRAALSSAAVIWATQLSEAEQEAWWDIAEGSQTGQTLFVRTNQPRIYAQNSGRTCDEAGAYDERDVDVVVTPPESPSTPLTTPSAIVIDDSLNQLAFDVNATDPWVTETLTGDAVSLLFVYGSHQQNASRFKRQHSYSLIGCIVRKADDLVPPGAVTMNLATHGYTTFAGKVMYLKFIAQTSDGATSVPIEVRQTIVA